MLTRRGGVGSFPSSLWYPYVHATLPNEHSAKKVDGLLRHCHHHEYHVRLSQSTEKHFPLVPFRTPADILGVLESDHVEIMNTSLNSSALSPLALADVLGLLLAPCRVGSCYYVFGVL